MKKLTILTSILTWLAAASWAQGTASHFTLCDDALSGTSGMTVTAILDLSNTSIYWGNSYGRYQVGAFVEGECHAIAMEGESENMTYWNDRDQYGNWFVLKLKYSSARRSKPVRFKLYNDRTGIEYELKNDDNIRTIGVNYGLDTNPIVLKAVEVTNISFNDFEMTAGSSYDLGAKLTLTPSNGTIPSNLVWDISPSTYSLDDNGFGAYHFYPSAAGTYEVDVYNPGRSLYARSGIITVKRQPNYVSGLSINSGYETNEVPKGDASTLGDVLARALKVSYYYPNEAPDEYPEWESSNTSVVRQDATGTWMPVGKGTCTMTAKVYNKPGDASSGVRKSASLTIKVTNYVTSLNVLHYQLNCYVGDDLTDYLPRTVEIEPADADKPTFDYQPVRSSGILERRSDGHIVAIGEGNGMVQVTAKSDGGDVSVNISVMVQNAWNDVAVKQPTLSIKYTGAGSAQDITSAVKGNISYLPASATYFAGYGPTVTSSNPSVVSVENVPSATGVGSDLTATAHKAGTATITVTLESPNLLEESVANVGTAVAPKTVTRSFDVIIEPSVAGISLPGQLVVIMGQTLDLKTALTVEPQDAKFDYSKVRWSWNDEMKGYFEITNNVLTPKKPYRGSISLTATVEGSALTAQTRLYILQPATALNVKSGFEKIEVFVGQSTELTDKLNEAFVVTPENSTDVLSYTIEKEDIVENERDATFYPKKQGTTKVTATLYDLLDSDSRKSPRFSKSVEVVVKVALQDFSFDQREYSLNVGQTLDLKKELRLSPADADIDLSQVVWTVEDNTKAKVDNSVLTALAPTAPDYFEVTATLGSIKASTVIYIYSPATAINVNSGYETVEVYVGESEKLTEALKKAVTIVPANSTSSIWWEFADESIVGYDDMTEKYTPLKGGTTKGTALAKGFDGNVKAEITVKVLVKGSSLSFEDRVYYMNVGEVKDFTNELNIYPADAVFDKSKLRLSAETQYKDYVQIDGLKVKALLPTAPKDFVLTATYEGTGLTATTDIRIFSPATAINVNSGYETIEVYVGESDLLTDRLKKAVTMVPANTTDSYDWEFADESIVKYDDQTEKYIPLKGGTTKATAVVNGNEKLKAELTIKVLVKGSSLSFEDRVYYMNVGEVKDFTNELNIYPADAVFDKSKLRLSAETQYKDYVQIDGLKVKALLPTAPKDFVLTATYEGTGLTATTDIRIFSPATAINVNSGYETIEVYVGESDLLTDRLKKAVTMVPANTTDSYDWEFADESIVKYDDQTEKYIPLKGGTTKATAVVNGNEKLKAELTIKVLVKGSGISFDSREYQMNIGETIDFTNELKISPADAVFDKSKVVLSVEDKNKDKVQIDGLKVKALLPTAPDDIYLTATYGDMKTSTFVTIFSPATAINVNSGYETVEVYVGESEKLTEALKKAVTIVPANSTSSIWWEFADESIVGYDDMTEKYTPLKGGTTKGTALAKGFDGNVKAEITVKVLVKGSSLSFEDRVYYMNVGEVKDFTNELNIYPADAVFDKSKLRLSAETQYKDYVQIDGLKVKALLPTAPKDFVLTATYEGTGLTATTDIRIFSPATAINVNSGYETIEVYVGESDLLTDRLKKAVTMVPANTTDSYDWEFADESIVKYDDQTEKYIPLKGGTTKATAVVNGNEKLKAELTIKVLVKGSGISFDSREYQMNVGETIDFTNELKISPADAVFDKSKVVLSVEDKNKDKVQIDGLKVKALLPTAPDDIYLTATYGDMKTSTFVTIFSPATAINVNSGYETVEVYVGESEKLTEALKKAVTIVPANSTSSIWWEFADESIVGYDDMTEKYTPLKGGTTKGTALAKGFDGNVKAEITVKVLVKGSSLSFEDRVYYMNVGEVKDFTNELNIYPADAVFDKSKLRLSAETQYKDYVQIDGLKVKALLPTAPKDFVLTATYEGTGLTATTDIRIFSPATAINVNSGYETVEVYVGESEKLTEALKKAVTIVPANSTSSIWWEFADESIVGYDDMTEKYIPLKGGTTKATALAKGFDGDVKAEIMVKVLVKSGSMSFKDRFYPMNVGETKDFTDELTVYPADAVFDKSKVKLSVDKEYKDCVSIVGLKVTALLPTAPREMGLTATLEGSDLTAYTDIVIYNPATAISVNRGYETIEVYVGEDDKLTDLLKKAIKVTPENTTSTLSWDIADEEIVKYDDEDQKYKAIKGGTTKLTVTVDDNPSLKAELTIIVLDKSTNVTSITLEGPDIAAVGVPATFTVKGNGGTSLTASAVKVSETNTAVWPMLRVEDIRQNSDGSAAVTVMPLAPGADRLDIKYAELSAQKEITIGVPTTLMQGWQWMTLYSDTEKDPAKVFGANIAEVRSQTDLLAYEDGEYYGTLSIEAGKAYMVRAANAVTADKAFVQTGGQLVTKDTQASLYDGWTWLAYPYCHAYTPTELNLTATDGDRIVSKSNGFVEYYDGAWTGTLTRLNPFEAYLYYNNRGASVRLTWQSENMVYTAAQNAGARLAVASAPVTSHYDYDPSPYRTNMTIISEVASHLSPLTSDLQIGAFVGGECRGEGRLVDGKFFITVHANDGELVSFTLYDGESGIEYPISETVAATRMLGTVQQPLQLTADTQGIAETKVGLTEDDGHVSYDLGGRAVQTGRKGQMLLQRERNGSVRKYVCR